MALGVIFFISALTGMAIESAKADDLPDNVWVEAARYLRETEIENGVLPKITSRFPSLTITDAYQIQNSFIESRDRDTIIAGYKAGFTGTEGREKFGVQHPVSGVLFEGCGYRDGISISLSEYPGLMLEIEIGFRLKKTVKNRIEEFEDLEGFVTAALPVIELPQVKFGNMQDITGIDLVSTNMASACWIEGAPLSGLLPENYDSLEVELYRGTDLVDSGLAGAVNGQREALIWLINHLHERNISLDQGLLLLTGKIGKISLARVGEYRAVYEEREVVFKINP